MKQRNLILCAEEVGRLQADVSNTAQTGNAGPACTHHKLESISIVVV